MRTEFLALTLLVWSSGSALAAPLEINTHTAAVPEQSVKLAGIYWLPDYLKENMDNNHRTETAPAGSGDRQDLSCSTYGGCAGVPAHMTCSQSFRVDGTNCYKSCSCKSGYIRVSSGDVCQGCYNPCDTVAAVPTPYGCQAGWSVCPSKCQIAYPDNCHNRTAVSTPYDCQTLWSDCSTKCQVAYPDNCHNRTAVPTPYGCQTPWSDCSTKCQVAYPDNCRYYSSKPLTSSCANGCAQGRTLSDCTSRCAVGCKARCDTGYHLSSDQLSCVADSCPSGYTAGKTCGAGYTLEKSGQSGTQYCGRCVVKACAAGSTSCSGATVAAANGYYSGDSQCYTCQSCEQAGQKTCNGSCIATSQCCGGCPTNYACQNGTCVQLCTPPSSAQGWVPMSQTPPTPNVTLTPTGATGTGANSCFSAEWMTTEETADDGCGNQYHRTCLDLSPSNGWFYENTEIRCQDGTIEWDKQYQQDGCGRQFECCNLGPLGYPPHQERDYCEGCTYLTSGLSATLPLSASKSTVLSTSEQLCNQLSAYSASKSECEFFYGIYGNALYEVMFTQKTQLSLVCKILGACPY